MKRLGSTRAAALLGITGGAAVLAAILRWVQLSNDIKSNGAVLPGRYLYLVIAVLSVAVLAALAVLIRPLRRQTRWEEIFSGGKLPNILHIASAVCFVIGGVMLYYASLPKTEDEALALTQLHDPKRVPHVLGCSHTAAELAARFGEDPGPARRAGLLHDVTKALPGPEQLKLCDKYGMMLDTFERSHPKLLHAKSGAAVAGAVFGESAAVQSAICWHTTGKPDMTLLQKILYLADYMEPNRDFPGVERLRALAQHDLDEAVLLGLEMSLDLLTETGQPIDVNSRAARDFLKSERKKAE